MLMCCRRQFQKLRSNTWVFPTSVQRLVSKLPWQENGPELTGNWYLLGFYLSYWCQNLKSIIRWWTEFSNLIFLQNGFEQITCSRREGCFGEHRSVSALWQPDSFSAISLATQGPNSNVYIADIYPTIHPQIYIDQTTLTTQPTDRLGSRRLKDNFEIKPKWWANLLILGSTCNCLRESKVDISGVNIRVSNASV